MAELQVVPSDPVYVLTLSKTEALAVKRVLAHNLSRPGYWTRDVYDLLADELGMSE